MRRTLILSLFTLRMLRENQDLISWRQTQRVMGVSVVIGLVDTELGVISIYAQI